MIAPTHPSVVKALDKLKGALDIAAVQQTVALAVDQHVSCRVVLKLGRNGDVKWSLQIEEPYTNGG